MLCLLLLWHSICDSSPASTKACQTIRKDLFLLYISIISHTDHAFPTLYLLFQFVSAVLFCAQPLFCYFSVSFLSFFCCFLIFFHWKWAVPCCVGHWSCFSLALMADRGNAIKRSSPRSYQCRSAVTEQSSNSMQLGVFFDCGEFCWLCVEFVDKDAELHDDFFFYNCVHLMHFFLTYACLYVQRMH